uniref:Uncharacterized protein n=1 Tax=Hemipteran rhabdo-related virus OKIAV26 TaxID=2746290 RepID=A0A7D7J451_9RHAB|nr:hypothetical protein [Hemipteran rhabdo-related virus OKIAV26]
MSIEPKPTPSELKELLEDGFGYLEKNNNPAWNLYETGSGLRLEASKDFDCTACQVPEMSKKSGKGVASTPRVTRTTASPASAPPTQDELDKPETPLQLLKLLINYNSELSRFEALISQTPPEVPFSIMREIITKDNVEFEQRIRDLKHCLIGLDIGLSYSARRDQDILLSKERTTLAALTSTLEDYKQVTLSCVDAVEKVRKNADLYQSDMSRHVSELSSLINSIKRPNIPIEVQPFQPVAGSSKSKISEPHDTTLDYKLLIWKNKMTKAKTYTVNLEGVPIDITSKNGKVFASYGTLNKTLKYHNCFIVLMEQFKFADVQNCPIIIKQLKDVIEKEKRIGHEAKDIKDAYVELFNIANNVNFPGVTNPTKVQKVALALWVLTEGHQSHITLFYQIYTDASDHIKEMYPDPAANDQSDLDD